MFTSKGLTGCRAAVKGFDLSTYRNREFEMIIRPCWTFTTPHGDFTIAMNDDGRFEPSFKGENNLGSFYTAEQALEDLCREFPGLPGLDKWTYTATAV